MKTKTRADDREDFREIWDSPLFWSTIALYSIATVVFLWPDFARIIAWVTAA